MKKQSKRKAREWWCLVSGGGIEIVSGYKKRKGAKEDLANFFIAKEIIKVREVVKTRGRKKK